MKLDDVLKYQTLEEARTALEDDLADLNKQAKLARRAGHWPKHAILHGHINEDLELLADVIVSQKLEGSLRDVAAG